MNRRVDQDQLWICALQALHSPATAVSRTIINDPKDAASIMVRQSSHDLLNEAVKGFDAVLGFAAAKDPRTVDIETGDVSPGPASKVFVFHLHRATRASCASGMFAPPGLDAGFLVCRDHEFIGLQRFVFPGAGIQVENAAGFIRKVGIAGEDPAAVIPGANRVLMQPPPKCAPADGSHQS